MSEIKDHTFVLMLSKKPDKETGKIVTTETKHMVYYKDYSKFEHLPEITRTEETRQEYDAYWASRKPKSRPDKYKEYKESRRIERWMYVHELQEFLSQLEPDDWLLPNDQGNLVIDRKGSKGKAGIGQIDFHFTRMEFWEDVAKGWTQERIPDYQYDADAIEEEPIRGIYSLDMDSPNIAYGEMTPEEPIRYGGYEYSSLADLDEEDEEGKSL